MGKVYDALQRAEEQRARRIQETQGAAAAPLPPEEKTAAAPAEAAPHVAASEAAAPAAPASAERRRPSLLDRLRWRRAARRERTSEAGALNKRRIALLQPESFVAEQFRTLRARIDALSAERPIRTIAVTSALPGDGKSMSAIGLAVVSAMNLGRRVLLIDCDLRQPSVHRSLGLRVGDGLAEVLREEAKLEDAVVRVENTQLDVLAVRSIPPNPSELLASSRLQTLLALAAERFDRVVLDLPPALGLPDAKIVSDRCDGVVFVVRSAVTQQADIENALDILDRGRLLGLVLNDAEIEASRYGSAR